MGSDWGFQAHWIAGCATVALSRATAFWIQRRHARLTLLRRRHEIGVPRGEAPGGGVGGVVSVWGDPCTLTGNLSTRSVPPCATGGGARRSCWLLSSQEVTYVAYYYPCRAGRDDRAPSGRRELGRDCRGYAA